ncbi:hypothetical protein CL654_00455 [bacterium]|nr:hypothetical protein [bacterium]|tara:strand:+ start:6495 stop:7817 length:1323 start_codon:yes stop_codon:yes gene_type:complete
MKFNGNKEAGILFVGDILFWAAALWLTLLVRYQEFPGEDVFVSHIQPFGIIFIVWALIFFIASLYNRQTILSRSQLPTTLLNTQVVNSVVAVLFFYFIPYFGITPKINLFIDLAFSFALVLIWRLYISDILLRGRKIKALIVGEGKEVDEIVENVHNSTQARMGLVRVSSETDVADKVKEHVPQIVILDLHNENLKRFSSDLYSLLFSRIVFVDIHDVYEGLFGRVALSYLDENWFLEHMQEPYRIAYSWAKRGMDVVIALVLGLVSLLLYPIVYVAIKLEDGGALFIKQERLGEGGRPISITKFRSMTGIDVGDEALQSKQKVTKVGAFLRVTRLDELPQLWNVLKGDLSLIGPRPEIPALARHYKEEIPYYDLRHLIRPGLSGWAQIYHDNHPHHGSDVEATKEKLSYDFYYIKNRGIIADLKIALKTLKTLFSRSGV